MIAMETDFLSDSRFKLWKVVCVDLFLRTSCPRRQCIDGTVLVRFGGQSKILCVGKFSNQEELESG
jgi:hypothetical protein